MLTYVDIAVDLQLLIYIALPIHITIVIQTIELQMLCIYMSPSVYIRAIKSVNSFSFLSLIILPKITDAVQFGRSVLLVIYI